ncbi:hypothetical protein EX30DRAFT_173900 [Ascodesmis nigricans]|uniref:Uncharacterized protein n=1 Tax=Ascodesmis nigricans TaxID=341454 RepID=A0A4S2MLR2_9PEZI|nr:hypothetical protein EX30DRAFT_173900 [Ascodesmis nigricans]
MRPRGNSSPDTIIVTAPNARTHTTPAAPNPTLSQGLRVPKQSASDNENRKPHTLALTLPANYYLKTAPHLSKYPIPPTPQAPTLGPGFHPHPSRPASFPSVLHQPVTSSVRPFSHLPEVLRLSRRSVSALPPPLQPWWTKIAPPLRRWRIHLHILLIRTLCTHTRMVGILGMRREQ